MVEERQFCTFHLGDLFLGVPVVRVQEVLRYQPMTRVPLAPDMVSGLINLRGQIVTAIDLRSRMGLPPRPAEQDPMNVVLHSDTGAVSLLVDEIGDVLEVEETTFEEVPRTVDGMVRDLVEGVFKMEGRLLLVLDTDKTLAVGETVLANSVSER